MDGERAPLGSGPPGGLLQAAVDESGVHPAPARASAKVNGVSAAEPLVVPRMARTVMGKLASKKNEYARWAESDAAAKKIGGPKDFVMATHEQPHDPHGVFSRLRWGGLFVYATTRAADAQATARQYAEAGFSIEEGPALVRRGLFGLPLPIPLLSTAVHYFVARKVQLLWPGEDTERFTYSVRLAPGKPGEDELVVLKEVPTTESVIARLSKRFPEIPLETLTKRAEKFTEKIFPTFLTREAGILMIMQDHLPDYYARKVPRCLSIEQDERGFVRKLRMNWLRVGGAPLSHMEFAAQSADLLRALHDIAKVIHLDLRLDNFVITPDGVGFVDFGSAVRDGEDISKNPLLHSLFEGLMRTSQIQVMMERMTLSGAVTSSYIKEGKGKIDKAADFFYLALQFNNPHQNPDLANLILFDPKSEDARRLSALTAEILRPKDPNHPRFRSAKDILHGIERMQLGLDRPRA